MPRSLVFVLAGALAAGLVLFARPGYLSDYTVLGALIGAEVLLFAVLKYRQVFFALVIIVFLLAGVGLPFQGVFLYARWAVLAVGAVVGIVTYIGSRRSSFNSFHLIAFFCVLSAIVSALVSAYPEEALLKAVSLTLLFVYAATGARAALPTLQPELFFRKLLSACEVFTAFTAVSYFALRWQFLGNPNSLGAVMGVVVVPMLLWGLVTATEAPRRRRIGVELLVAILLLMSSFARAAILGAAVSAFFLCFALKQYRLMIQGVAASAVIAVVVVMFAPQSNDLPQWDGSEPVSRVFLYKGHAEAGVLGSRRGVWTQTWDVIKDNSWFGSGYGTSVVADDASKLDLRTGHIDSWIRREHGNSYLAITEWVGLLGVLPFFCLVLLSLNNARKVLSWVRKSGDAFCPALPAAAIAIAGIVHGAFEDWMFAVGYYLCVFFWANAFILVDLLPCAQLVPVPQPRAEIPESRLCEAARPA